jgi:biopolymer transport protein ExbD
MKLESSLNGSPGWVYVVPALNLLALLWLIQFTAPSMARQFGITVQPPPSRFQLERFDAPIVITIGASGDEPRIHLGRDPLTLDELSSRLDQLRLQGAPKESMVLLQTDASAPSGIERQISELVLSMGFKLALLGSDAGPAAPQE